jgi:hypothetical protein
MANFTGIDAAKAPPPPATPSSAARRMKQYDSYLASLKAGQVGKLVPGANETPRGVAMRIGRAAKRGRTTIHSWVVDGVVYFSRD